MSRNLKAFFSAFIVSASLCFYWLYTDMQAELNRPMNVDEPVRMTINQGMSFSSIASMLVQQGWINHSYYLTLDARWYKKARLIKAGEYEIAPGTTQLQLLDQLIAGRVVQYALTIPEGLTFRDIVGLVMAHPALIHTLQDNDPAVIAKQMDYLKTSPEGQFYPDTYHFPRGTTDIDFFRRAFDLMQQVLAEEWEQRQIGLPYTIAYEALIMASIIEKETAEPSERDRIAGVFVRRLQQGMKLQTDPTVIYAMGSAYNGNIRKQDLYLDSPFNTYVYSGLPPTPIAAPGRDAIRAALQPAAGEQIYFVAKGDGTHQFSATLKEHNRAVRLYQLSRANAQETP